MRIASDRWQRLGLRIVGDSAGWILGLCFSLLIRFDGFEAAWAVYFPTRLLVGGVIGLACLASWTAWSSDHRGWIRYGSFEELMRVAIGDLIAAIVLIAVNRIGGQHLVPDSVVLGAAAIAFVISCGLRFGVRLQRERKARPKETAERVVVFGAGEGGEQTIQAMLRDNDSPYIPVALLDDDPRKQGMLVRGVRVRGGRADLEQVCHAVRADSLVIAIPGAGSELIRDLAALGTDAGLAVRVLPPVRDLFGEPVGVGDIRPITEEDLLGRDAVETDLEAIAGYLQGRRVLVTGAGGSIGSEICRQVWQLAPERLVMLDRDESAIHALQLELEGRAMLDSRNLVIADIRDRRRMYDVMAEHQPHVVFHAAALKHLPLLEMHPSEALKSNVQGTRNVLDAAGAVGVDRFVNISTDKAADPVSALGYSKRIAEGLTAAAAEQHSGTFLSVRFGNVLGSRGSVLTAFEAQIARGGPITVTHPDVTRYFMTVTEAVHLVIQAGAVGGDGEALVLDMGEPVRIADVATQLAAQAPRPIEVVYTGLRPAEKLHEDLLADGEVDARPNHPLISQVPVPVLDLEIVEQLGRLERDDDVLAQMALICRTAMAPTQAGPSVSHPKPT